MFFLSWLTALGSGTASVCLITLTDSPEGANRTMTQPHKQRTGRKFSRGGFSGGFTSEDGLIDTQGGGLDGNNPDVSWDFVTNCGKQGVLEYILPGCYVL